MSSSRHQDNLLDEDDEDDDSFVWGDYDAQTLECGHMVCEVAELAARNLIFPFEEDNPDDRCEGRMVWGAVNKIVNDLRFLVPTSSSYKWDPEFINILSRSHSMRITEVGEIEREDVRKHSGKCVICGTWEKSSGMVVELCGDCDGDSYDARDWNDVKQWPALFDKLLPAYDAVKLPSWKWPRRAVPKEYHGAYTVGSTCIRHLVNAFVAQTLTMELTFGSWSHVVSMGEEDPGYKNAPTVTEKRVKSFLGTLEDLKACAATDFPRLPAVPSDPSYWKRIDTAVSDVANRILPSGTFANPRLVLGGIRARELLKRSEHSGEEDDESEEDGASGVRQKASSRAGKRNHSPENQHELCDSDGEFLDDLEDDCYTSPDKTYAPARKSSRPTRKAAANADAARRRMCCGETSASASAPPRAKKRPRRAVVFEDEEDEEPVAPSRSANTPASVSPPDVGARRLRSMISDPSNPDSRMLRGYETTISEAMELSLFLHAQGHALHSAAASRIVVVIQELVEKNHNLRAAAQQ